MFDPKKINQATVIGAGSWGTTIANILTENISEVILWGRNEEDINEINSDHVNRRFLPNLTLPNNLTATTEYEDAFSNSELFVWAIPVQFTRERLMDCGHWFPEGAIVINLSKGLESDSWYGPSEVIAQVCSQLGYIGTLSGPNLAAEISAGKPASATLAVKNYWELAGIEKLFSSRNFHVGLSPHLTALEVAGALKNIIAIAVGICDGMDLGWNIKSSVIAKGFGEMQLIGGALGANKDSFSSVFALGDLVATCGSPSSRNRTLGERIGMGETLDQAELALNGRVAEGVVTTFSCYQFAKKIGIELPLMSLVRDTLVGGVNSEDFVTRAL